MKPILLDGSNVSLSGSKAGKLTDLSMLAQMTHCLLANSFTPYTIFDASFRYRILEQSIGRQQFNTLTKQLSQYFQMSPSGEEADLFLLQLALELECPVVSNDVFKKYGKLTNGRLSYESQEIPIYNFQLFAGVVIIPDLRIRRKVGIAEKDFTGVESLFENPPQVESDLTAPAIQGTGDTQAEAAQTPNSEITDIELKGMRKVISRFLREGAKGGLAQLGPRLSDYRRKYEARTGKTATSKKRWFGFESLGVFLKKKFPDLPIEADATHPDKGQSG